MASTWIDVMLDNLNLLLKNYPKHERPVQIMRLSSEQVKSWGSSGVPVQSLGLLKLQLGLLRTFLLCARRWISSDENNGHSSLNPCLSRLEDAYYRAAPDLYSVNFRSSGDAIQVKVSYLLVSRCRCIFRDFTDEINGYYDSFTVSSREFSPPVRDELVVLVDSLLENLVDLRSWSPSSPVSSNAAMDYLEEKLTFAKDFLRFVTLATVEDRQLDHLLTSCEVVTVHAASCCYRYWFDDLQRELEDDVELKISQLTQRISPVDPEAREIYVQVLTAVSSRKLSGSSYILTSEVDKAIWGDFVDSLLGNLFELLVKDANLMESMQDQLIAIYEGLRFLRTVLKKQQKKFDELQQEIKDLVGAVVIGSGIWILSLSVYDIKQGLTTEMDISLFSLLENLKHIETEVANRHLVTSAVDFPKSSELGFLYFLSENLNELVNCTVYSTPFAKDQLHSIQEDLMYLRIFFENIVEQPHHPEMLQALWSRFREVAYQAKIVSDSLVLEDMLNQSPMEFCTIKDELELIKMQALEIDDDKDSFKASRVPKIHVPLQGSTRITSEVVVGFNDEAGTIIDHLIRGSMQLDIVSIVGMAGLGKTTLARKVYNDPSIKCHFHICAWCFVSQVYCLKDLLLQILVCIAPTLYDQYLDMNGEDLAERLFRQLKGKRYFIVLDDMWDKKVWFDLETCFPDDANGSRVLLTSRLNKVALEVKPNSKLHQLRRLTDEESWELLQIKLFHRKGCPPELRVLGRQIATNCNGLPLTIVLIAGILATLEQDNWEEVAKRLISKTVGATEQCMDILELSYGHLPNYLKPCLLYFGVFPEDQEIPIQKLIWLWIAEGFVQKTKIKSLEEMAEEYIMDLIGRSLVMVAQQRSIGRVKTCQIHGLIHEFCVEKSKEENFMHLLLGYDELFTFHKLGNIRRLSIHPEHFVNSRLCCPRLQSLVFSDRDYWVQSLPCSFFLSFRIFKLVTVLDFGQIAIGCDFPSEIGALIQLRYLTLRFAGSFISASIGNLLNLETFVLKGHRTKLLFPAAVWDMKNLRHLHLFGNNSSLILSGHDDKNSQCLYSLDTCSTLRLPLGRSIEQVLKKLPNIRRLKCILCKSKEPTDDWNNIVVMDFLSRLESLNLRQEGRERQYIDFHFPLNLKKLTLTSCCWGIIYSLGKLPNLEVLKLLDFYDEEEVWEMKEEGEFPKLKFLKLGTRRMVRWAGSGDHLLSLEKLVLEECYELKEVPEFLGHSSTLEVIELHYCPDSVVDLVKEIEEEQWSMGNENLKIIIHGR